MLLIWWLILLWWVIGFWLFAKPVNNQDLWTVQEVKNTENTANTAKEVIAVGHNGRSLVPEQIVLQAGKEYEIQVTPSTNGIGCMFAAVVPKLSNEEFKIEEGKQFSINVSKSTKPGTYPVVCTSMGMSQGEIIIE